MNYKNIVRQRKELYVVILEQFLTWLILSPPPGWRQVSALCIKILKKTIKEHSLIRKSNDHGVEINGKINYQF